MTSFLKFESQNTCSSFKCFAVANDDQIVTISKHSKCFITGVHLSLCFKDRSL